MHKHIIQYGAHLISRSPIQLLNSNIIGTSIVNRDSKNATNTPLKHTRLQLRHNSLSFVIRMKEKYIILLYKFQSLSIKWQVIHI
jgi:hypothetical protein